MKIGRIDSNFLHCSFVSEGRFHSHSPIEQTQSYVTSSASVFPLSVSDVELVQLIVCMMAII